MMKAVPRSTLAKGVEMVLLRKILRWEKWSQTFSFKRNMSLREKLFAWFLGISLTVFGLSAVAGISYTRSRLITHIARLHKEMAKEDAEMVKQSLEDKFSKLERSAKLIGVCIVTSEGPCGEDRKCLEQMLSADLSIREALVFDLEGGPTLTVLPSSGERLDIWQTLPPPELKKLKQRIVKGQRFSSHIFWHKGEPFLVQAVPYYVDKPNQPAGGVASVISLKELDQVLMKERPEKGDDHQVRRYIVDESGSLVAASDVNLADQRKVDLNSREAIHDFLVGNERQRVSEKSYRNEYDQPVLVSGIKIPSLHATLFIERPRDELAVPLGDLTVYAALLSLVSLIISLFLAFLLSRHITRPIVELSRGAESIASGDLNYRISLKSGDEIEALGNAFNRMTDALRLRIKSSELLATKLDSSLKQVGEAMTKAINVSREISSSLDLNLILLKVAEQAKQLFDSDLSCVYLLNPDGFFADGTCTCTSQRKTARGRSKPFSTSEPYFSKIGVGKSLLISDLRRYPDLKKKLGFPEFRSYYAFPIVFLGKVIGMIALGSKQPRFLGKEKINLFNLLADEVGTLITNARSHQTVLESENKYRNLVDYASAGVYKTNLQGDILLANESMARILEFGSSEELMSQSVLTRYKDLKDREILIKNLKEEGKVTNFEVELLTKTGQTKSVILSAAIDGEGISGMVIDITERKRAEEELRMQNEMLGILNKVSGRVAQVMDLEERVNISLGTTMIAIGIDAGAVYLFDEGKKEMTLFMQRGFRGDFVSEVNRFALKASEFGEAFVEGKPVIFGGLNPRTSHSLPRDYKDQPLRSMMAVPLISKDKVIGSLFLASVETAFFNAQKTQLISSIGNIMGTAIESALMHQAVEQKQQELQTIQDSIGDGLVVTDRENRLVAINPVAREIFNLDGDEALFKPVAEVLNAPIIEQLFSAHSKHIIDCWEYKDCHQEDCPVHGKRDVDCWQVTGTLCQGKFQTNFKKKSQVCLDCQVYQKNEVKTAEFCMTKEPLKCFKALLCPVRDSQGQVTGQVMTMHDLTEEKKVEQMKTDFVSTVSHELRSPLTAINGFASTLLNNPGLDQDTIRKSLGIIHKQSSRLSQLISDLLVIARIEEGRYHPEPVTVELSSLVERVIHLKQSSVNDHKFHFKPPEDPAVVIADEDKVEQVLLNLVDNAVKYSPSETTVSIDINEKENDFIISVADQGIGIPAGHMDRIFEKFYRVDNSLSREIYGTGLGLSIVKELVEAHQGKIWIYSEEGKGTKISFSLPKTIAKETGKTAFVLEGEKDGKKENLSRR